MFPRSLQMPLTIFAIPFSCSFHLKFSVTERVATVGCNFTQPSITIFTLRMESLFFNHLTATAFQL
jgi:hypothetical protein